MRNGSAAVIGATGLVFALVMGPATPAQSQSSETEEALADCDQFMESYVRSSARKLGRGLDRGEYGFLSLDLDDSFVVSDVGGDVEGPVKFDVLEEKMGEMAAVIDRDREFPQTYVVAEGDFGPLVIGQTWKPRDERAGEDACQPLFSTIERPEHPASMVEIEPFHYWGIRVAWRVPSPETVGEADENLEEALRNTIADFDGDDFEMASFR